MKRVEEFVWEIEKEGRMRVPARIFASEKLLEKMQQDETLRQARNVATLPGIYKYSLVMPDGHQGYGFPIGGVAALDYEEGGLSPGGIGFDINCGVRLIRTNLEVGDVKDKIIELVETLFVNVPSGVGVGGKVRLSRGQLDEVLQMGARWAVENGYGWKKDLERLEEGGCLEPNDPDVIGGRAKERGAPQLGSLGAGNHFLEIERVERVYDQKVARAFGIEEDQIVIMVHTGSRGFGHQVCTDYLKLLESKFHDLVRKLPDRELVYAPAKTKEVDQYFRAMACAANFAWANRQMITHWVRESFSKVFGQSPEDLGMDIVYDVAHNIAKIEEHEINGERKKVYVHRKGATRSLPPGHPNVPEIYREVGQPVLIPGHMGTGSWLMVGGEKALELSFGSAPHGAGRMLSRMAATRKYRGEQVKRELRERGIYLRAKSWRVAAEEAPGAYKDLDEVARVAHELGIARYVARLKPLGVVKG